MKKHVGRDFTDPNMGETAGRAGYRSGEKRGQKEEASVVPELENCEGSRKEGGKRQAGVR